MRTRFSRGLAAALAVSALSLTAACGGGADEKADGAAKGGAEKGDATAAPQAAAPLTAAQMKAGVLALTDLPAGWKASKAEVDTTTYTVDDKACQPIATLLDDKVAGATIGASVDFERGNADSLLSQQVMTFPGKGAADYASAIGTALGSCSGFSAEMEGMKMKITLEKLTAPQGAEQAHAFRIKMNIADLGLNVESNMLVAAQGTGLTRFSHVPADASGHKDFDGFAKLAVEKFAKGAKG
ncbi:hypothetical protein [Streptomyces sp. NPDC003327]